MEILERHRLKDVLASQELQAKLVGARVCIYSRERFSYWRSHGTGYTTIIDQAGIYDFDDAFRLTSHSDPEKRIEFMIIKHAPKNARRKITGAAD